jgi:hypothetical protein
MKTTARRPLACKTCPTGTTPRPALLPLLQNSTVPPLCCTGPVSDSRTCRPQLGLSKQLQQCLSLLAGGTLCRCWSIGAASCSGCSASAVEGLQRAMRSPCLPGPATVQRSSLSASCHRLLHCSRCPVICRILAPAAVQRRPGNPAASSWVACRTAAPVR